MTSGHQGTFGQRGATASASVARAPAAELQTDADESEEREPGLLASLFGIDSSEDDGLDVRLSEEYAADKTLWIAIPLWLIAGVAGVHRFYLGHTKMGLLILGTFLFVSIFAFSKVTAALLGWWVFGDGIYVIVRKLRAM